MASYSYSGINERGKRISGQLNANNEVDLYQRLKALNVELVSAKLDTGRRRLTLFSPKIKNRDLVQICLHVQQLQAAGVGLLESLADVRDSTDQRRLRDLISEIHADVSEGASLSEAFGRHPRVFGTVFESLIAAGEASGNLVEAFAQLIKHLKWIDQINTKVKKAIRYPSFMIVVMVGLFMFMMTSVVPQVTSFLASNGQKLPFITVALIATSEFVQRFWWVIIALPIGSVVLLNILSRSSQDVAYRVDYLKLRLPMFGPVLRKISLSRFAHFFATMFQSGVPILTCLETAQKVVGNLVLSSSLGNVRTTVQEGNSLSSGLKDTGEFPTLVIRMVKIGEDSGSLGETLENVTEFYDGDVNETVDAMVSSIEPVLTLFAGVMMAWIVAAVLGPIYSSMGKMSG
ncbi:MAG TPA: type II secretion system F family protein [Magnetospirillaceae bacterium]|jgi:type IV pilus assembly protein PilC